MQFKSRRLLSGVAAAVFGLSIIVTGTLAWQSISQTAKNEVQGVVNPGARLHDDFDGRNKDIYVENFSAAETNGVPVFARVRLHEYMEVGPDAGKLVDTKPGVTILGKPNAKITDPSTWLIHNYGIIEENGAVNHKPMHQYWNWHYGGKTTYMPTFNKNKDSLKADINGTFAGLDGNREEGVRYDDYVQWELGQTETKDEVYDNDTNNVDEGDEALPEENIRIEPSVEHTAVDTREATVVSMEEWLNMESPIGDYWVYDTDGWAYYANAIMPGEATGLLLDGITSVQQPNEEWYYAIHAVGQFATAGDWGNKSQRTGFYKDGITDNALNLLDKVAGQLPQIEKIEIQGGARQSAKVGETKVLKAIVDVKNPTGNKAETYVTWTVEPTTTALVGDKFTPTADMVGKRYTITATSAFDIKKSAKAEIIVYPQTTQNTVTGDLDGKTYIDLGDNTFREVRVTEEGQELGPLICGGADKLIGNGDDNTNVVELEVPDPIYGSKFLGPNEGETYWAMGPDGKLGTGDDIKVIGHPWPHKITNILADAITITTTGNGKTVKVGEQEKLTAKVTLNGEPVGVQDVTWSIAGQTQPGTTINQEGYLTVSENEQVNKMITVTATSKEMPTVIGRAYYTVAPRGWEDLHLIPVGSNKLIFIDGKWWQVLGKENGNALISAWDSIGNKAFSNDAGHEWPESTLRTYLNGDFLDEHPTLKAKVVETTITTRTVETASLPAHQAKWHTTSDKVFLPSTGDALAWQNGATNDGRDFTTGTTRLPGFLLRTSNQDSLLRINNGNKNNYFPVGQVHGLVRSPFPGSTGEETKLAVLQWAQEYGSHTSYYYHAVWGCPAHLAVNPTVARPVRPMMWVKLPTPSDLKTVSDEG